MSSRRLLVLLAHAREFGPYRTALRAGAWPLWVRMLQEIHKELALSRSSRYVGTDYEYEPQVFVSPAEFAERVAEEEAENQFHQREFGDLVSRVFGGDEADDAGDDDDEGW